MSESPAAQALYAKESAFHRKFLRRFVAAILIVAGMLGLQCFYRDAPLAFASYLNFGVPVYCGMGCGLAIGGGWLIWLGRFSLRWMILVSIIPALSACGLHLAAMTYFESSTIHKDIEGPEISKVAK